MTEKKKINKIHIWTRKPGVEPKKVGPKESELKMILSLGVVIVIFVLIILAEYRC